jgi:TolA-binding protein
LTARGKVHWDFGDGQTSEFSEPTHVYLRPGLYTVKMTLQLPTETLVTANQVEVAPLLLPIDNRKVDQLSDYLSLLERYDVTKLSLTSVLQLVRACEQGKRVDQAARAGKTALEADWKEPDEQAASELIRMVGPMLRDQLDDPAGAVASWQAAGRLLRRDQPRAECEIEVADILLHDLLQRTEARKLLDIAAGRVARSNDPALTSRFYRVLGDCHARGGDREAARAAYSRAASSLGSGRTTVEVNALRGALSRSTEAFLREKELDRALKELRRWQDQFPSDKLEGYLPLLQAQHWLARGKYRQPIAVAGDLIAANPESPYADQLAFLAAECEERLGQRDRAQAAFKTFLTDYPGSPLVEKARKKLAELGKPSEEDKKPTSPVKPTKPPRKP